MRRGKGAPVYPMTAAQVYFFGLSVAFAAFAQTMFYVAALTGVAW